jgi:hypothetical protein
MIFLKPIPKFNFQLISGSKNGVLTTSAKMAEHGYSLSSSIPVLLGVYYDNRFGAPGNTFSHFVKTSPFFYL